MEKMKRFEEKYLKKDVPKFRIGDTVLVHVKIKEEGKTRTQVFEGVVMRKKGSGVRATFTVRRISYGEGVERTFPLHSPFIQKVETKKRGRVSRAKLYYLRKKKGKRSKVDERIETETRPSSPGPEDASPRTEGA